MLFGMVLLLDAHPVHAQTGFWQPYPINPYVPVDANGNILSNPAFTGTPTGSATNSYPSKWQVVGQLSYPFGPNISNSPNLYGDGPFSLSSSFSVSAFASNSIYNQIYGAYNTEPDTGNVSVNEQCDYTLTLVWDPIFVSYTGTGSGDLLTLQKNGTVPTNPAPPSPPTNISLLITVSGGGGASVFANTGYTGAYPSNATGSAQISDSLGDGGSYSVGSTNGWQGPARHLVKVSGGKITKTIHVTGQAAAQDNDGTSVSYRTFGSGSASMSFIGTIDPRSAGIASSLSPTYYKDKSNLPTMRSPNKADSTGTLTDDTVVPTGLFPQPYTCTGSAGGGWAPVGTTYSWSSNPSGGSYSGDYPNIVSFSPIAKNVSDGVTDTVTFKVTDGMDGATEPATYSVRYHDPVPKTGWSENFSKVVVHPLPTGGPTKSTNPAAPFPSGYGEWSLSGKVANNTPVASSIAFSYMGTATGTVSGTIGATGTETLSAAAITNAFSQNYGLTIGASYSVSAGTTTTINCAPGGTTYEFSGLLSEDHSGTCDVYGRDGYDGVAPWHCTKIDTNGSGATQYASPAWAAEFIPLKPGS